MQLLLHAGEPGLPPPGGGQDLQRRIQLRPLQVHHPLQEYNLPRSHATSIIIILFGFLCPIALLSWSVILYNLKLERGRLPSLLEISLGVPQGSIIGPLLFLNPTVHQ